MSEDISKIWYYSNHHNAQAACEHCKGIIRHEQWCITLNPGVSYACQIVADPSKLTAGDGLILHAWGVIWAEELCQGIGKQGSEPNPLVKREVHEF